MNKKVVKTIGVLLLLTAVAVSQVPVSDVEAVSTTSDFQMDGSTLIRYSGTAEVVSIPDDVTAIAEEAFSGNDNLVKVTIDGKVKSIGYGAFSNCNNLRTVVVGNRVESIDTAAFSNNSQLKHVSLGANVGRLGSGVFAGCSNLSDLTVSADNNRLFMEDGILYGKNHEKLYLMLPTSSREELSIPNDVKEIMGYAFWGNHSLKKVSIGSGLYEVPAYAFSNCMNLIQVDIPLPVRSVGAKAFEDCVSLKQITIPESVTNIHETAFDGCPQVTFSAAAGTYGADYAQQRKSTQVEEVEYEDVQNAHTIQEEQISVTSAGEAAPTAGATQAPETTQAPEMTQEPETQESLSATPQPTNGQIQEETETVENRILLGQSSIVTNHALVFIDNGKANVRQGTVSAAPVDLSQMTSTETNMDETSTDKVQVRNLLADNAEKGKSFPKYTVVNQKIASQAYYQDEQLTNFEFPEGITEIGEFAFARSNLESITIPEGVTKIGYGAFYHCDHLKEVHLPDTVTEIEEYAFAKTPFMESGNTAPGSFLIVGDGILIGYQGGDSIINIPGGVKQIADGVFKDHMGITAVNLPDTVTVIGEEAFQGCKNLATVNGGKELITIKAGAFQGCPLSTVTISDTVQEIGLAAFDLDGGTDTVTFLGTELPELIMGNSSSRINHVEERTYAFGSIGKAIIPVDAESLDGTILEDGQYGFHGRIYDEGNQFRQQNTGIREKESGEDIITVDGSEQSFVLRVEKSTDAAERITAAYGELYGGRKPVNLEAYDISLFDDSGTIPITRLGKQSAKISIPMPDKVKKDNLHVVTLDQDGQMEAVPYQMEEKEGASYITFLANHFSPYGIYNYEGIGGSAVVQNGKAVIAGTGNKDNTPDTGDFLHPKWFLTIGLVALAVLCFLYKGKQRTSGIIY